MSEVVEVEQTKVLVLRLDAIRPFKGQPRHKFDGIPELAESIKEIGQITPVTVRELVGDERAEGKRYELIDGERRYRACQHAGRKTIRAVVDGAKDRDQQFLKSVVANFGRSEHTAIESALAVARICEMPEYAKLPVTERNARVGAVFARTGQWVLNMVRLAKLPKSVRGMVAAGDLSANVAQFLTAVKDPEDQEKIAYKIVSEGLRPGLARNLIREHIAKHGTAHRISKPTDHHALVFRSVRKIAQDSEVLLDMPMKGLAAAFVARPKKREALLEQVDGALSALQQLKDALSPQKLPARTLSVVKAR